MLEGQQAPLISNFPRKLSRELTVCVGMGQTHQEHSLGGKKRPKAVETTVLIYHSSSFSPRLGLVAFP